MKIQKVQVFTLGPVGDELRDRLSTFALGIRNLHRTGPWMHVAKYTFVFVNGETRSYDTSPDCPVYAAHCFRQGNDGSRKEKMWIILRPNHPLKNMRWFFADREGGEL